MPAPYDPRNWYWTIGGDTSKALSSASGTYVDAADAAFAAWLAQGNVPSRLAAESDLLIYLAERAPELVVCTPAGLSAYANAKQWALATGGYSTMLYGVPRTFNTDGLGMTLIAGKQLRLQQAGAPAAIRWQFDDGFVQIAAADFTAVAIAIADFVQASFDVLGDVLAAIAAGTIATRADVDAAAWPQNHP